MTKMRNFFTFSGFLTLITLTCELLKWLELQQSQISTNDRGQLARHSFGLIYELQL